MLIMVNKLSRNVYKILKDKYVTIRQYSVNKPYKLLFFGSDNISLTSFHKVNEFRKTEKSIECIDLVVTNTSLRNTTQIEKYAQEENINTIMWPLPYLKAAEYDLGLIVAFGHLIKADLLNKFPLGMVNVHPSLLPRWRGAAPIIHTLLLGDNITGVTLMKIKADIFDVGEIISQRKVPIPSDIKLPQLTEQLSNIGADMLVECLKSLPDSINNAYPQSKEGVTYAKKINKNISEVHWHEMTARDVYNLYRAIYGLYPLTTKFRDKYLKLFDAFIYNPDEVDISKPIGSLEYCNKTDAVRVLCKDKRYVYFRSLRIVGKRQIKAIDFYNGYIKNMPVEDRNCLVVRNSLNK